MAKIQVISGGQTGVDQAALRAAKGLGITTGGWMPLGWLTEDGPRPDFAELYGMEECDEPGYPARTLANVEDAGITLWFGPTGSRGYGATLKAAAKADRRIVHADYYGVEETIYAVKQAAISQFLTVNCAGSRESGNPGIGAKAETFFVELFAALLAAV